MGSALFGGLMSKGAQSATELANYQVPDESVKHERTFMQWPMSQAVYTDPEFLSLIQNTIAKIANAIVEFEPVVVLMDETFKTRAQKQLSSKVEIWNIPTDDLWCRDSGPLFTANKNGEFAVSQLNFNGWGNKQPHKHDGQIAARIVDRLGLPILDSGLKGEAGGVESDGHGTLLAHESCWVNNNRNAMSKPDIEERLLKAYGARKMIWAPGVKGADITDYHIDSLARFVGPGKVLIQLPEKIDDRDPWSVSAYETYEVIKAASDADGRKLEIIVLPEPVRTRVKSADFVSSYVNFYVCNNAVISAQFGDKDADAEAKSVLSKLYPDREIVQLNIDALGESGGGIHCATQQQPIRL